MYGIIVTWELILVRQGKRAIRVRAIEFFLYFVYFVSWLVKRPSCEFDDP